jgi:dUTP pyrophosphatase
MKIRIINNSDNPTPEYQTGSSAGMDIHASLTNDLILKPLERCLVPTGLYLEIPPGYEAQIRPRSGLAIKHGITVLNTPGTIDADYRGEVKVILINLSEEEFKISNGDRIAQMVISNFTKADWEIVEQLDITGRKEGGFGSTGH